MPGARSIFVGKQIERKDRIEGALTPIGLKRFEAARRKLAGVASVYKVNNRQWKTDDISDGDVIEYLARGHDATVVYLTTTRTKH